MIHNPSANGEIRRGLIFQPTSRNRVMTDHPRFQIANREPDECHRQFHGGALVEWVFRVADWWLEHREALIYPGPGPVTHHGSTHDDAPQR
jgi:hypothetical protein